MTDKQQNRLFWILSKNKGFILFLLIFFILMFIFENINHRFWLNDFKVYYLATESFLEGNQVYGIPFGLETGFYKYSPFLLLIFTPYCLLPFSIAIIVHYSVIAFSSIAAILVIQNVMTKYFFKTGDTKKNLLLSMTALCILSHLVRELHMGNMNIIIVLILSMGLLFTLKTRYILSGICIGIAIMIKPYFLLLMLPLLLHKKIKTVFSVTLTLLFSVGITILILGFSKGVSLHQRWITAMLEHNSYITSNETIQSLIKYYIYPNVSNFVQYFILLFAVIAYVFFFLYFKKNAKKMSVNYEIESTSLIIGYFILLAIIPNLVLTDTEHFLFSLPLIILLLNYLSNTKNYIEIAVFILIIFFYGWNNPDLLGHKLSDQLDHMGMLGISNLLMIGFSIYVALKNTARLKI